MVFFIDKENFFHRTLNLFTVNDDEPAVVVVAGVVVWLTPPLLR